MSNIATSTSKAIQSFSSSKFCVPAAVVVTAVVIQPIFRPIYRGWRALRLYKIYINPENHAPLAIGHGINLVAGDRAIVKTGAICLHILAQIINCADELQKLERELEKIKNVWRGRHIRQEPVIWRTQSKIKFISISRQITIIRSGKEITLRVRLIAFAVLKVGKHMFLLTMNISYLVHMFFQTNDSKNDSVNEIFINSEAVIDKLSGSREFIINKLKNNEAAINMILTEANSKITASDIIKAAENRLTRVDNINTTSKKVRKSISVWAKACKYKWWCEFLSDIGLERFMPAPDREVLQWEAYVNIPTTGDRYPPLETITKPGSKESQIVKSDGQALAVSKFASSLGLLGLLKSVL